MYKYKEWTSVRERAIKRAIGLAKYKKRVANRNKLIIKKYAKYGRY